MSSECIESLKVRDLTVCLTRYKNFTGYRLTKTLDDEVVRRVYQWLGLGLNVYENTIVFTDGREYYVAEFPQSAYAVVIHSPEAKKLALDFIHMLEMWGREYLVNQTVAKKLAIETGATLGGLKWSREEIKEAIRRKIQEITALTQGGMRGAEGREGEGGVQNAAGAPPVEAADVEAICERLKHDERFREAVVKLVEELDRDPGRREITLLLA